MKEKRIEVTLGDGKTIESPESIDINQLGYFDELEYAVWELIQKYMDKFEMKVVSEPEDPDFYTVKAVQDCIIEQFIHARVKFNSFSLNNHQEIYIIEMECENATECCTYGSWTTLEKAQDKFKELVENDEKFNSDSHIDYEEGIAESNPMYNSDEYVIYRICKLPLDAN